MHDDTRLDSILHEIGSASRTLVSNGTIDESSPDKLKLRQLALAGASYATRAASSANMREQSEHKPPPGWSLPAEAWRPGDHRQDLVRAAGLIVAEIKRLDRLTRKEAGDAKGV